MIDENEVGQYANSLPEDGDDAAAELLELGGMRAPPGVGGQSMEEEHYGSDQDSDIDESFPRGGRGGQEGSTTNKAARDRIDNVANSYNGSTAWAYATRKDDFPPNRNKCNKFVCDVLQEAGHRLVSMLTVNRAARARKSWQIRAGIRKAGGNSVQVKRRNREMWRHIGWKGKTARKMGPATPALSPVAALAI